MILLDTCALLWWTLEPEQLSHRARTACDQIHVTGAAISSISLWEIGIKIKKGTLDINDSLRGFVARLKSLGVVEIVPIDERIWLANLELQWEHRDPADRTIVATAQLQDLPLVTKDPLIAGFYPKVIW
jgi:PIN domain nuclease of toxin-antitoxin system